MKESRQSVYGSLITVKTFWGMLVGAPASLAGNAWAFAQVALGPAAFAETFAQAALGSAAFTETFAQAALGSAAFTETFAQVAQVPREMLWRLRKPRKFRGICRDVCASRASPTGNALTFAQVAQVPRHLPRRLRRLRKHQMLSFCVLQQRCKFRSQTHYA